MRARNLKPGFFKNEDLAECSPWARLCFAGLWLMSDRDGRLEDRPKRIKGELFAYDSIEVEPLLCELEARGFIARYVVDGLGIIQIVAFSKHQNPHHREPESELPPMPSPGLDGVGNHHEPWALQACDDAKAPGEPRASPGISPQDSTCQGGQAVLIPDSGIRSTGAKSRLRPTAPPRPPAVPEAVWRDFLALRKAKRAPLTDTALAGIAREAEKAGVTLGDALATCCKRGWQGFDAEWVAGKSPAQSGEFAGAK